MKVVIDTNVIISALAHGGKPFIILSMARKAEIELVFSPFLFDEIKRVIAENNLGACNYLIDMRLIGSIHYMSPEALEIYSKKMPAETKMNKAAIVGKSLILETTVNLVMQAAGRSQSFRWFNDFEEAKKWLTTSQ